MSINKVILVGRLGRDPELKHSPNTNTNVCNFSLATSERRKDQTGQWVEQTEWHNIVTFSGTAENCHRFLKKGSLVFIEGQLNTSKWVDKEGRERTTTKIVASNVQFLEKKEASVELSERFKLPGIQEPEVLPYGAVPYDDDDIPF